MSGAGDGVRGHPAAASPAGTAELAGAPAGLPEVAFLGGGNMAAALIGGLIDAGVPASRLRVLEIQPAARDSLRHNFGVLASDDSTAVLAGAGIVVLAVKPQSLREACLGHADALRAALVISIAAGIRTADIARWLGGHTRIVRAMPNTPALVRAGITGVFATDGVSSEERAQAGRLMAAVGGVVWLPAEMDLDAVTAISGSGPAYVFHFMEGLIAAGEALGLSPAVAHQLALQTVAGAARLAVESPESPTTLRVRVTSPKGTTEAALASLQAADFRGAIVRAAEAAARRSAELGDVLGADPDA